MAPEGRAVDGGIGEEGVPGAAHRAAIEGRHAPIHNSVIVKPLVGRIQERAVLGEPAHHGIQSKALPVLVVPMVFHIPIGQGVEAEGAPRAQRLVEIDGNPFGTEAVEVRRKGGEGLRSGRNFGHPIDDAATATPPKEQRIGAPEHFHALEVVQGPEILHVVPKPIEKEIGGGVLTPDGELVPVVFPLPDAHPRGVLHDVRHAHVGLLPKLLRIHNGNRLRHIQKERGRFHALRQRLTKVGPAHHDGFDGARALLSSAGKYRTHQGESKKGTGKGAQT